MSTCNFITQKNFPLYVYDCEANLEHKWVCPDCLVTLDNLGDSWECPLCGCHTDFPEADGYTDEGVPSVAYEVEAEWLQHSLDEYINAHFEHWRVDLIDGYFYDWQLIAYFEDMPHGGQYRRYYEDPAELYSDYGTEEDDARLQTEAAAEMGEVREAMEKFAEDNGFTCLNEVGRFNNGEAVYKIAKRRAA